MIIKNIFAGIGIVTIAGFLHELVHIAQAGFQVNRFCLIGFDFASQNMAWVAPKVNYVPKVWLEPMAYFVTIIFIAAFFWICFFRIKKKEVKK